MHVETSFVRNLGGLIRVRQGRPDRLMKAKGRTMSMHADEGYTLSVAPRQPLPERAGASRRVLRLVISEAIGGSADIPGVGSNRRA
jgi:hypothetical protein